MAFSLNTPANRIVGATIAMSVSLLIPSLFDLSNVASGYLSFGLFSASFLFFFNEVREMHLSFSQFAQTLLIVALCALTQPVHEGAEAIRWIWDGLIQHYDVSPFLHAPNSELLFNFRDNEIYALLQHRDMVTTFSPLLLILGKFLGIAYLTLGFASSLLITKAFVAITVLGSVIFAYRKRLFPQVFLLALLLNPVTIYLVAQADPILFIIPVGVFAYYQYYLGEMINFWLLWGLLLFLSPLAFVFLLAMFPREGWKPLLSLTTYLIWWIPLWEPEAFLIYVNTMLLQVPPSQLVGQISQLAGTQSAEVILYFGYLIAIILTVRFLLAKTHWKTLLIFSPVLLVCVPVSLAHLVLVTTIVLLAFYVLPDWRSDHLNDTKQSAIFPWLLPAHGLIIFFCAVLLAGWALPNIYGWLLFITIGVIVITNVRLIRRAIL